MDDVNPQAENGHTDIANEILEALGRTRLSSYESCFLFVLWRKTWGWHKKSDRISISQFSLATGIADKHICRTKKRLIERGIVVQTGEQIGFNKTYTQWGLPKQGLPKQGLPKQGLPKQGMRVPNFGNRVLPKLGDTKETITKETIQKKSCPKSSDYSPEVQNLVKNLIAGIAKCNSPFRDRYEGDQKKLDELCDRWAEDMDKLVRIDKAKPEDVEAIIRWLYSSDGKDALFWRKNILSAAKLREQYLRLVAAAQNERQQGPRMVIIS